MLVSINLLIFCVGANRTVMTESRFLERLRQFASQFRRRNRRFFLPLLRHLFDGFERPVGVLAFRAYVCRA